MFASEVLLSCAVLMFAFLCMWHFLPTMIATAVSLLLAWGIATALSHWTSLGDLPWYVNVAPCAVCFGFFGWWIHGCTEDEVSFGAAIGRFVFGASLGLTLLSPRSLYGDQSFLPEGMQTNLVRRVVPEALSALEKALPASATEVVGPSLRSAVQWLDQKGYRQIPFWGPVDVAKAKKEADRLLKASNLCSGIEREQRRARAAAYAAEAGDLDLLEEIIE